MRILVVGGAGYIGSVTVAELLEAGHEVVVFDSLVTGHAEAVSPGAELVVGDLARRRPAGRRLRPPHASTASSTTPASSPPVSRCGTPASTS